AVAIERDDRDRFLSSARAAVGDGKRQVVDQTVEQTHAVAGRQRRTDGEHAQQPDDDRSPVRADNSRAARRHWPRNTTSRLGPEEAVPINAISTGSARSAIVRRKTYRPLTARGGASAGNFA